MSPSPFDAFKPLAGRALQAALNRALSLDPDTQAALRPLEGKRIALTLEAPALAMEIGVEAGQLRVGPARIGSESMADEPDLAVRSTLGGLFAQLPFLRKEHGVPIGRVKVSGDAELARRLQTLAERFDPDWQQPFTAVFGDILGIQIANAVRTALRQAKTAADNLAESAAEYVTEESGDVVASAELNAFHDDVDALRDDVERLAARVQRLATPKGAA